MTDVLSSDVAALVAAANPDPEPVLEDLAAHAEARSFPFLGPAAGHFVRTLARATGASRVFEFGSGFGYSAAWWAGALGPDGELVLTDYDASNLETAREFLSRGGYAPAISYEVGDAVEVYERYEPGWDAVLVDHEKSRYGETLDEIEAGLAPGAVVVADNVMEGPFEPADVLAALEGESDSTAAAGVADYLSRLRSDPDFESVVVPLGEGLSVAVYDPDEPASRG